MIRGAGCAFAFATAFFGLSAHAAFAAEAYISNEKSNTVSVLDTDKMGGHENDQGGPAPARHRHEQGRQVRRRRRWR